MFQIFNAFKGENVDRRNFNDNWLSRSSGWIRHRQVFAKSSGDKLYLRPPGAVDDFDDLCVKCGQCVQVCPYHSINLLDIEDGYSSGSAHIDAKERGCYLCDLFPCVLACPSGALDHATKVVGDVKMGVAVLSDTAACLSVKRENFKRNWC